MVSGRSACLTKEEEQEEQEEELQAMWVLKRLKGLRRFLPNLAGWQQGSGREGVREQGSGRAAAAQSARLKNLCGRGK